MGWMELENLLKYIDECRLILLSKSPLVLIVDAFDSKTGFIGPPEELIKRDNLRILTIFLAVNW